VRYSDGINLPFVIWVKMPKTDLGKKGYSPQYIKELQTVSGGNW
jgi:hypothetical protein